MEPIRNFDQLTSHLKTLNKRKRIAVVCANAVRLLLILRFLLQLLTSVSLAVL